MSLASELRQLIETEHARTAMVAELLAAGYTRTPIQDMLGMGLTEWYMAIERLQLVVSPPAPWKPPTRTIHPTAHARPKRPVPPVRITYLATTAEPPEPKPAPKPTRKRRPRRPATQLPQGWTIT